MDLKQKYPNVSKWPLNENIIDELMNEVTVHKNPTEIEFFKIFTDKWIKKSHTAKKGRLALMLEFSWQMWKQEKERIPCEEIKEKFKFLLNNKNVHQKTLTIEEINIVLSDKSNFFKIDNNKSLYFIDPSFIDFFMAKRLYLSMRLSKAHVINKLLNEKLLNHNILHFLNLFDQNNNRVEKALLRIPESKWDQENTNIFENIIKIIHYKTNFKEKALMLPSALKLQDSKNITIENLNLTQNIDFANLKQNQAVNLINKSNDLDKAQEFFKKGVELLKEGRNFDSLEYLFAAKALDPDCMKASNNLAVAFRNLNSLPLAVKMTQKVLEQDPENERAKQHIEYLEEEKRKYNIKLIEDLK